MTNDEIEKKARVEYEASREPGHSPVRWDDLPELRRIQWRELVVRHAGRASTKVRSKGDRD